MGIEVSELMGRAQELQERIAALSVQTNAPAKPFAPPVLPSGAGSVMPPSVPFAAMQTPARLFDVALAEAGGSVSFRPLSGGKQTGKFTPEIDALINKYAAKNGLDVALVRGVVEQESSGDTRCTSRTGAQGLMQLMPSTARGFGVTNSYDPEQNIAAGTRYLAGLLKEFKGDTSLALAAYNAGSGAVKRAGGIPNYPETQAYVRKIMGNLGR